MKERKNVLLLFSDQHRGDWLPGMEGCGHLRMPNLRSLMDQGVTFTDCMTPSPLCAPARACLALGEDYDHCGTYNNRFCMPLDRPTMYSLVRDSGYRVGNSGKLDLHKPCLYWSKTGWLPQLEKMGFTDCVDSEGKWDTLWASYDKANGPYGSYLRDSGKMGDYARDYTKRFFDPMITAPTGLTDSAYADNWVTDTALRILDNFYCTGEPWFMTVNFSGPHDPWDITEDMYAAAEGLGVPAPVGAAEDSRVLQVRRNYAAMLENIDRNIGRLLESLKASGQYENTLIIYGADHGEMLGDRGMYYKTKPYRASVHIPLILSGSGIRKGVASASPVQLQDLTATIAEWCGTSLPEGRDGRSLLGIATGKNTAPVRNCLISKLSKQVENENMFADYEEYAEYRKTLSDKAFFSRLCKELEIPWQEIPPVHREEIPDWACVTEGDYKLILYADGRRELYRRDDLAEQENLLDTLPDVADELQKKHHLTVCGG